MGDANQNHVRSLQIFSDGRSAPLLISSHRLLSKAGILRFPNTFHLILKQTDKKIGNTEKEDKVASACQGGLRLFFKTKGGLGVDLSLCSMFSCPFSTFKLSFRHFPCVAREISFPRQSPKVKSSLIYALY